MTKSELPKYRLEITPYKQIWPTQFNAAKVTLGSAFGNTAIAIRHIGSTAVPGLAAKNRIDIQVTVKDLSASTKLLIDKGLAAIGLQESEQFSDHRPPGDMSPEGNWQKFLSWGRNVDWGFDANIHFRVEGYANHRFAILFRDYLRNHPNSAVAYQRVKETLSFYVPEDREAYNDIKDPVVDLIVIAAETWAKQIGWQTPND
jgi:GrpB-like predicted nucleotidyltransferase (UPF0157 family)